MTSVGATQMLWKWWQCVKLYGCTDSWGQMMWLDRDKPGVTGEHGSQTSCNAECKQGCYAESKSQPDECYGAKNSHHDIFILPVRPNRLCLQSRCVSENQPEIWRPLGQKKWGITLPLWNWANSIRFFSRTYKQQFHSGWMMLPQSRIIVFTQWP